MSEPLSTTAPQDENQIVAERREKLAALRNRGVAFPNDFERRDQAGDLHGRYAETAGEALASETIPVQLAGRMMLKRVMGKASFATLQDLSGRIQIYVARDQVGEDAYDAFKRMDLGDILGVSGHLFRTKTNELTIQVNQVRLLTKALRPLPEKFHGLADTEQKYRQRYLDLITSEQTRLTFIRRSRIIQAMREFFIARGFLEVETPMMHPIPGGASAKPFVTHHNTLDMELFLRIAPELYLKRLVVGGLEKVFEINRNFRNEGISTRHNPEFTMVEFYEAYRDYKYLMDFVEQMLRDVAIQTLGHAVVPYQGQTIDLSRPFARLTALEATVQYNPELKDAALDDRAFLIEELKRRKIGHRPNDSLGGLQLTLFEETTEQQLIQPTYIIDYPIETSPLARASDSRPGITERFELYIAGREVANGFSELNDPEDQAARFQAQVAAKEAGDEEAMYYDADYIRALEHGLPPTAGCGIGIDRLVMLLTDAASIRDVILFPLLRKED
ncbi:MAG: lysine--tRNA ligase [Hydrogenophilales bacterium CG03_land_8_20_14_0_80_62_28]|nr:lysine--tRNA ligase [Betaproteobacteria bacterium]OIO78938.1 MAG: lysine--tRNA ligase [Hydrogenophilaceae bacterium CG1_02_62_390]PIV24077.1 MAG: lysine--tRNA ligase [Hydrogenophilales bacterium CG03_land_8_20_14_0_80_62_28]PIW37540.1 MAG: lysine--tRNA ligase [Hydrogenophilales bacterium CG15_BIG_FIL_POST_REV_8_21_14_020_62_31]PIW70991.1 MAG: lysine--tRNA ligase [Hydrogenophilales bacterium CG12_big_fil_rev_8_21_14_0_65_61_21]PIX00789.1 MAG: lysine--tRNA ligase [Hydrogenophilales bacterium 